MLETIREYASALLEEAGDADPARRRHAQAFLDLAQRERDHTVLLNDLDNFRAALDWSLGRGDPAGPRLAAALGGFWLATGLFNEARSWLERALSSCDDVPLRAEVQRLLGTVLYETGPLDRARLVLTSASAAAAAAGLAATQARIEVVLADIGLMQGADPHDVLRDCQNAAQVLQSAGDAVGLAEAWLVIGQQLFHLAESPAYQDALERAAGYARQSGNQRALAEISKWQVVTSVVLPAPADVVLQGAERLLREAAGDPRAEANILQAIPPLYAYVGRIGDARAAVTRSQALHVRSGAEFDWALAAIFSGADVEMTAGDPAAAEKHLVAGIAVLRAGGERGYLSSALGQLAEALYAQDRFDEAWQVTEEAETLTAPGDFEAPARWKATRAKLLARRGEFTTARQLGDEAIALTAPTQYAIYVARALIAKAEVDQLAGMTEDATTSLRQALRIYEDRKAELLAQHTRSALSRILTQPRA
jgi:tetratricopeptide (TPR) repeat protein